MSASRIVPRSHRAAIACCSTELSHKEKRAAHRGWVRQRGAAAEGKDGAWKVQEEMMRHRVRGEDPEAAFRVLELPCKGHVRLQFQGVGSTLNNLIT